METKINCRINQDARFVLDIKYFSSKLHDLNFSTKGNKLVFCLLPFLDSNKYRDLIVPESVKSTTKKFQSLFLRLNLNKSFCLSLTFHKNAIDLILCNFSFSRLHQTFKFCHFCDQSKCY